MKRKTKRLELIPLGAYGLKLLLHDLSAFERVFECSYQGEKMEGILYEIFEKQAQKIERKPEEYLFHTLWIMKERESNIVVGGLGFKGMPSKSGRVEIGYGMGELHRKKGLMQEAVSELCCWALEREEISIVIAETEKENIASQRVLEKVGMHRYSVTEDAYWYEFRKER